MYSPLIVDRNLHRLSKIVEVDFTHYSPGDVLQQVADMRLNDEGLPSRPLSVPQQKFIQNEQHLCRLDFQYFAERYATIQMDGGGVGRPKFWETQRIAMRKLAARQDLMREQTEAGGRPEGICMVWHKARQLGATMLSRMLLMHRVLFHRNVRGICATVDDKKIQKVYERDHLIYDNLPFYLKPPVRYDEKRQHIQLENGSGILYQISSQEYGLGTGEQYDIGHLSELSTWRNPATQVEIDFFPTLPQSETTLCVLESTAYGRHNWWHDFSESVRQGRRPRWIYIFVPWYAEPSKYLRTPPDDWVPSMLTEKHAQKVEERSAEFVGHTVRLGREQLHWYESERDALQRAGKLNFFLTNYCVSGDTKVSTDQGIVRIADAQGAKSTESGEVSSWVDQGVKSVVKISTYCGRELVVTPDHRIFLVDGSESKAGELQPGQEIALVQPKLRLGIRTLRWNPIPKQQNSVVIDEAWGRFLGYFMGDGCYYNHSVRMACTRKDKDTVRDVCGLIKTITGREPTIGGRGGVVNVTSHSRHWKSLFLELGAIDRSGSKGGWKRKVCVPEIILQSRESVVREFLSGLFEADGHAYPYWARTSLSTAYYSFASDVQLLLLAFGLNSRISVTRNKSNPSSRKYMGHLVSMGAAASDLFHEKVGFRSKRKKSARVGVGVSGKPDGRRRPNEMVDTVVSVTPAGFERVYDFSIVDTQRFGAGGILVHNCATPEESFQHSGESAFPPEFLEKMRLESKMGVPYEVNLQ